MSRASVFWELMERADTPGTSPKYVTWRDVEEWEPGTLEWLEGLTLIREVAPSETALCDQCLDLHQEHVQYRRLADGELIALLPCPSNGLVTLNTACLRRWQIDLPAFAAFLARKNLYASQAREVIHQRCWQLSTQTEPAFLIRGALWADAAKLFTGSTFPRKSRLVHLAPLSPNMSLGDCEWYPLSQVFHLDDLRLEFKAVAESSEPLFEMRRSGSVWHFTFISRTASATHRLGFVYLRMLLATPGHAFRGLELASAGSGDGLLAEKAITHEDLQTSDGYSSEEAIDDKYRNQVQDQISRLTARKNVRGLNPAEEKELHDLRQHLRAATDVRGRIRKTPREGEKARVSVTNAISRALVHIAKVLPEMAEHLRTHIKTGSYFSYEGEGVVSWSLPEADVVTSHVTS